MTWWTVRAVAAGVVVGVLATTVVEPSPALADDVRAKQWHLGFLDVATAHHYSEGAGVTVAVVDTGVDGTHPDVAGNVAAGTETFIGGAGNGWTDIDGHGTAMAGLIAAHGHGPGSADGALGIAPKATILPVRASSGGDQITAIASGIEWAIDHGAKVISISAGRDPTHDEQQAVQDATAHDIVVIAAVGNAPEATQIVYPAAYPGVVAVAGVDQTGNHASFSLSGSEVVLAAPAADIESTAPGGRYRTGSGTSDATAIVAGAAALVRSRFPKLSAAEVIHRLTATAIDKGPKGRDPEYGYGVVNLVGALTADVPSLSATPSAAPGGSAASDHSETGRWLIWVWTGFGLLAVVVVAMVVAARRRRSIVAPHAE